MFTLTNNTDTLCANLKILAENSQRGHWEFQLDTSNLDKITVKVNEQAVKINDQEKREQFKNFINHHIMFLSNHILHPFTPDSAMGQTVLKFNQAIARRDLLFKELEWDEKNIIKRPSLDSPKVENTNLPQPVEQTAPINDQEKRAQFKNFINQNIDFISDHVLEPLTPDNKIDRRDLTLKKLGFNPLTVKHGNTAQLAADLPQPVVHKGKYYYSEQDRKISHIWEAICIFFSTQFERFCSAVDRLIFKLFKIHVCKNSRYFSKDEDKNPETIYAKDKPLSDDIQRLSSYWIGHATCLISVPLKKGNRTIRVNMITDPVEGDLNKIFYPRMTKAACTIEECPPIQVFMLSHNHLDHYNEKTIKKLLKHQPIMIVPKGDGEKFTKLGFKTVVEHGWWDRTPITLEQEGEVFEMSVTAVPCRHWSGQKLYDSHKSSFNGYVISGDGLSGDIYFAGDTARLDDVHVQKFKEHFNIRTMYQPGGPDEVRKHMKSTHQCSADAIAMHFRLAYRTNMSKEQFVEALRNLQTIYMHTKTYKLGNLKFSDTDESVSRLEKAFSTFSTPEPKRDDLHYKSLKAHEKEIFHEIIEICMRLFNEHETKELCNFIATEIPKVIREHIYIPKIGQRLDF